MAHWDNATIGEVKNCGLLPRSLDVTLSGKP
jgi:hypothetical protein